LPGTTAERSRISSLTTSSSTAHVTRSSAKVRLRFGDVVTVMGEDTITYATLVPADGQDYRRRFTDLGQLEDGRWRLDARRASGKAGGARLSKGERGA
jgi:hypothetical protein